MSILSPKEIERIFKGIKQYNIDKLYDIMEDIAVIIEQSETTKEIAEKKIAEWNKDEEIQKLQNEIKELKAKKDNGITFYLTEKETKAISEWINKHIEEKHGGNSYAGAIGGRFSYNFTPTSIGDIGVIKCSCGDSFCFRELN